MKERDRQAETERHVKGKTFIWNKENMRKKEKENWSKLKLKCFCSSEIGHQYLKVQQRGVFTHNSWKCRWMDLERDSRFRGICRSGCFVPQADWHADGFNKFTSWPRRQTSLFSLALDQLCPCASVTAIRTYCSRLAARVSALNETRRVKLTEASDLPVC